MLRMMWHNATLSLLYTLSSFRFLSGFYVAYVVLLAEIVPCTSFQLSSKTRSVGLYRNKGALRLSGPLTIFHPCRSRYSSELPAFPEGNCSANVGDINSALLSKLMNRGITCQITDIQKLDEFLSSYESRKDSTSGSIPAIYYGIDLTNNFIHEGCLFQLLVLRNFLAEKFNVVVVLGGGTTVVGDPSFRSRPSKASKISYDEGTTEDNIILSQKFISPMHSEENEHAILSIMRQILGRPIKTPSGNRFTPTFSLASDLNKEDLIRINFNPYNVVVVNNRDLYGNIVLSQYLSTVADNVSVGRMLSRDCIKSRMSLGEGKEAKLQVNMSLAEFMYMTLQATDFIHVAAKYNAVIQLGGSDQMGNILSGVDLAERLGDAGKQLFGITTPLLQTPTGEKISKSVGENLLKITTNTRPLPFWIHFRNVNDAVVEDYLRWFTNAPLDLIRGTLAKHVNEGKILLADELTTDIFGKEYTDAIHRYWLQRDNCIPTEPISSIGSEDYDLFVTFTNCANSVTLDPEELEKGLYFGDLMDMLRTPQMVSGRFYSNRRAIREGYCRLNGQLITNVKHKVISDDLLCLSCEDGRHLKYITIHFGKRQVYFIKIRQT